MVNVQTPADSPGQGFTNNVANGVRDLFESVCGKGRGQT